MLSNSITGQVIHVPDGCEDLLAQLVNTLPPGWEEECLLDPVQEFLLVRHPLERMVACYFNAIARRETLADIKEWYFGNKPAPAYHLCPTPAYTIRYEHHRVDIATCLAIVLPPYSPPEKREELHICIQTRTDVRKYYDTDYRLGDYDEEV